MSNRMIRYMQDKHGEYDLTGLSIKGKGSRPERIHWLRVRQGQARASSTGWGGAASVPSSGGR